MSHIILASASPRRKELLSYLNLPFTVHPSSFEEIYSPTDDPEKVVSLLAEGKAKDVSIQFPHSIVIGSDTVVVAHEILGKPRNEAEAADMLKKLSGKTHSVLTAVSIMKGEQKETFIEKVDVTFWSLSSKEIDAYIQSGDPYDKAGGYGIQTGGALFVRQISGDYYAVVGLPISRLQRELKAFL